MIVSVFLFFRFCPESGLCTHLATCPQSAFISRIKQLQRDPREFQAIYVMMASCILSIRPSLLQLLFCSQKALEADVVGVAVDWRLVGGGLDLLRFVRWERVGSTGQDVHLQLHHDLERALQLQFAVGRERRKLADSAGSAFWSSWITGKRLSVLFRSDAWQLVVGNSGINGEAAGGRRETSRPLLHQWNVIERWREMNFVRDGLSSCFILYFLG